MMMMLALFLSTERENGITPTMAQKYFQNINWTTNYDGVKDLLEEMVRLKWASSKLLPYRSNMTVYTLTTDGENAVSTTHRLIQEKNPLTSLRAFKNLVSHTSISSKT